MSSLRTIYGSTLQQNDPRMYLVEAMVGAIEADGDVRHAEIEALHQRLDTHELFASLDGPTRERLLDQAADAVESAQGGRNRVEAIAHGLQSHAERVMAYCLACEMSMADGQLADEEQGYLDSLKTALGLPDDEAREIFAAVRGRSSEKTIEEQLEKMRQLIPKYIDAMVLLSLSDGSISSREVGAIEAVLHAHAEARSMDEAALREEVLAAFRRIRDRDAQDVIAEITSTVTATYDRFWAIVYMMIVAKVDGVEHWGEVGVLKAFQQSCGFANETMEAAAKIADQFPYVQLRHKLRA